MASPGGVDRWIAFELGQINAGLVTGRKSLARLRAETAPSCPTREGEIHAFDREALERLAAVVSAEEAEALRLPITFIVGGEAEDSAYASDALAATALRRLEGFVDAFRYRDGRMYLPHSLAFDLARRSGGTIQIAFA